MNQFDALKEIAKPLFSAVCKALPRNHERGHARQCIRDELDRHTLVPNDRRFIADYMMSMLGYGGGF